jgi:hypothetical protein
MADLFCCQGGAAVGYDRAGFDVVGVDIAPQPRYPFLFVQADAVEFLRRNWRHFDAVHASPTCQTRARVTRWRGRAEDHPDTLTPTLDALRELPIPWVVENVPEAVTDGSLRPDFVLCGSMFGLRVRRHRAFETSWNALQLTPGCSHSRGDIPFEHKDEAAFKKAMGCDWMTNLGGRQAIPPAYTEHIGQQLIQHLTAEVAA